MKQETREKLRGVVWLIPLLLIVVLLFIIARPHDSYDYGEPTPATPHNDNTTDTLAMSLRPFDPNEADYRTMIEAGVERRIAVSIIRWREAGKIFRIKEDLALCYGMTDSMYFALEPYINIGEEYRPKPVKEYTTTERNRPAIDSTMLRPFSLDSVGTAYLRAIGFTSRQADLVIRYRDMIGGYRTMDEFAECYAVDSAMAARLEPYIIFPEHPAEVAYDRPKITLPVDINSADSATLVSLRGIGPKSVVHILRYRQLLGGYYSTEQLLELSAVTEDNFRLFSSQIYCDSAEIKKICINFASPKELEVHPYLSNRMLRRIINNRELKGGWSTVEEMIEDNIFSDEEAARIAPYLDFGTNPE